MSEGRGSVPADAVASPRRWTISRRPLVLSAGGNTILFRLLTKPLFCSFPPLDARKASNGGFCSEREEVSEQHKELNKIFHVLFSRYPAKSCSPENFPGPLRGVRLSFFAVVFESALSKIEENFALDITLTYALSFNAEGQRSGQGLSDARR